MSLNSAGSGYGGPGPGSNGSGGGGGGGDNWRENLQHTYSAPAPAPAPVTDYEAEAYGTPDTIASLTPGPSPHGDGEANIQEQKKLDIKQMIAKQQEEKYGVTADPTKFGERAVRDPFDIPEDERTIEDKLAIENWEKAQDWDKVKDLAGRGHDFKEIQSAMDKGLLTKTDPRSMQTQGLLGRGLASLKNLIPKTGLEKSLLGKLTSSLNPKSMAMGALKSMALQKLGLGFLNPFLGIASLFGFNPFKGLTSKFAKKPAFDVDAASKLGLYDEGISPTKQYETAKARDAYEQPISTAIAKGTGLGKGYKMLGLHKGERDNVIDTPGDVNYAGMIGKSAIGATGLAGKVAKNPISNWLYRGVAPGTKAATQAAAKTTPWGRVGKQVLAEGGYGFGSNNRGFNPNYRGAGATRNPLSYTASGLKSLTGATVAGNIGGGTPAGRLAFEKLLQSPLARGVGIAGRVAGVTNPVGAAATATYITPKIIDALTKRDPGATRSSLFGIDLTKNVNMAHGGRIDKPLMGRSRDI
tara:strand:- start:80 stop:1657 length:1578 start_codon:yes stop_codon:yes gene_type:complete